MRSPENRALLPRREIEDRIRSLRMMLRTDPGDRNEIEGLIESAEAELRRLDKDRDR